MNKHQPGYFQDLNDVSSLNQRKLHMDGQKIGPVEAINLAEHGQNLV